MEKNFSTGVRQVFGARPRVDMYDPETGKTHTIEENWNLSDLVQMALRLDIDEHLFIERIVKSVRQETVWIYINIAKLRRWIKDYIAYGDDEEIEKN